MGLQERFPAYGGRGPADMRLGIALAVITTIFILLRVYVRLRINKFGTAALIWTLVAWYTDIKETFTVITQVLGILAILHGLGNHMTVIAETGQLHHFLLFTWTTVFFFNLAIPVGKVAVAAFLIEMNAQSSESFTLTCDSEEEQPNQFNLLSRSQYTSQSYRCRYN
ncbi:hypothetical protein PHISCL_00666 [Aspergillus sclerotialis]|uniref:Integral membrane protein n=1 Tax=Aspergillus sclerotialis TaxID=2070753 RepID=A0A3A3AAF2_9EURO|nr:hypothetical protein PHISCL_00666 [Aspergillus sclerotialis]